MKITSILEKGPKFFPSTHIDIVAVYTHMVCHLTQDYLSTKWITVEKIWSHRWIQQIYRHTTHTQHVIRLSVFSNNWKIVVLHVPTGTSYVNPSKCVYSYSKICQNLRIHSNQTCHQNRQNFCANTSKKSHSASFSVTKTLAHAYYRINCWMRFLLGYLKNETAYKQLDQDPLEPTMKTIASIVQELSRSIKLSKLLIPKTYKIGKFRALANLHNEIRHTTNN